MLEARGCSPVNACLCRSCSDSLSLDRSKKKQWVQLGFDTHGLRLQLHFLRAEAGGGYHLIHCRATPPPLQSLALSFTFDDGQPCEVLAEGRGIRPQTPFKLVGGDMSVRVPRHCRVTACLTAGGEEWRLDEVALQPNPNPNPIPRACSSRCSRCCYPRPTSSRRAARPRPPPPRTRRRPTYYGDALATAIAYSYYLHLPLPPRTRRRRSARTHAH